MGQSRPLFQTNMKKLQQIYVKINIWCWDSNPRRLYAYLSNVDQGDSIGITRSTFWYTYDALVVCHI